MECFWLSFLNCSTHAKTAVVGVGEVTVPGNGSRACKRVRKWVPKRVRKRVHKRVYAGLLYSVLDQIGLLDIRKMSGWVCPKPPTSDQSRLRKINKDQQRSTNINKDKLQVYPSEPKWTQANWIIMNCHELSWISMNCHDSSSIVLNCHEAP